MAQKGAQKRPEAASVRSLPQIAGRAEQAGFSHSTLNDVVDEWLNFGYCRVTDHVSNDIALTPEGDEYFGHRTLMNKDFSLYITRNAWRQA